MRSAWIVVELIDKSVIEREGDVVVDTQRAHMLQELGHAVLLPVDERLLTAEVGACGGFYKRALSEQHGDLGRSITPAHRVPLLLRMGPLQHRIHWAARVAPTRQGAAQLASGLAIQGILTLSGCQQGGLQVPRLFEPRNPLIPELTRHRADTYLLRGEAGAGVSTEGLYGLSLYGAAPGLRVLWAACSAAGD